MKFGMIGLGRMGFNLVLNALDHKHTVVAYNRSRGPAARAQRRGAIAAYSVDELLSKLGARKIVWLMITAGKPVDDVLKELLPKLSQGDIIIDGGNSFFEDSQRRMAKCRAKGVHFVDCGVSGGVEGARSGACMMLGADRDAFRRVEPLVRSMCVRGGYAYMGASGSGHYVKMVHNAIEYGMMGAIAEGMNALNEKNRAFGFDMVDVIRVYNHGSIVQSRLMGWLGQGWKRDPGLRKIEGVVPLGATEMEMQRLERMVSMPVLRQARRMREQSREHPSFVGKVIAAIRHEFGGHAVRKK